MKACHLIFCGKKTAHLFMPPAISRRRDSELKLLIPKKLFMSLAANKLFISGRFSKRLGFWDTMSGNFLMPLLEWFLCRKAKCPLAKAELCFWKILYPKRKSAPKKSLNKKIMNCLKKRKTESPKRSALGR